MYLREMGYEGGIHGTQLNSALGDHGELLTGWAMRNVDRPARVDKAFEQHMTDRAIKL